MREVTFIYRLNFTSVLSSYPPPALALSALIPSGKRRERVIEGFFRRRERDAAE